MSSAKRRVRVARRRTRHAKQRARFARERRTRTVKRRARSARECRARNASEAKNFLNDSLVVVIAHLPMCRPALPLVYLPTWSMHEDHCCYGSEPHICLCHGHLLSNIHSVWSMLFILQSLAHWRQMLLWLQSHLRTSCILCPGLASFLAGIEVTSKEMSRWLQ